MGTLSPCGRGRSNGRCERKRSSGEDDKMPIKYDELMALKNLGQKCAYSDREVMLYAYGIGMGADPMDEKELAFVNEAVATPRALKVVPTFASVAAWGAGPGEMNLNRSEEHTSELQSHLNLVCRLLLEQKNDAR